MKMRLEMIPGSSLAPCGLIRHVTTVLYLEGQQSRHFHLQAGCSLLHPVPSPSFLVRTLLIHGFSDFHSR